MEQQQASIFYYSNLITCCQEILMKKKEANSCLSMLLSMTEKPNKKVIALPLSSQEKQFKKQSYESALFYAVKRVVKHLNAVFPDLDLIAFYEKELKDLKEKGGDEK